MCCFKLQAQRWAPTRWSVQGLELRVWGLGSAHMMHACDARRSHRGFATQNGSRFPVGGFPFCVAPRKLQYYFVFWSFFGHAPSNGCVTKGIFSRARGGRCMSESQLVSESQQVRDELDGLRRILRERKKEVAFCLAAHALPA